MEMGQGTLNLFVTFLSVATLNKAAFPVFSCHFGCCDLQQLMKDVWLNLTCRGAECDHKSLTQLLKIIYIDKVMIAAKMKRK